MKKYIYSFVLVFLLISCEDKKRDMLAMFPSISTAVMQEIEIEMDSIRNPYMMECVQGKLFFANMNQAKMVSQFDLASGKFLGDFINRGEGPGELLFISTMSACDKQLTLFDSDRKNILFYSIDKLNGNISDGSQVSLRNDSSVLISAFNCMPLTNEYFVATGLVRNKRMALLDNTGKVLIGFGDYPGDRKATDTENGFAYQSVMAYDQTKKVLAVGSYFGESIAFYDMSNLTSPSLLKEYIYAFPKYKDVSDGDSKGVAFERDNKMGFIAMKPSSKYCIGLYNGKERTGMEYGGDKLLFFDWTGKAIKAMQLDQMYENMAYDENNDELILFGTDEQTSGYKLAVVKL